ncbi:MAG: signal recognition particle protein [Chloroflexi bacterium]|nr:signal recognition particle protein [Chloroflexota bacterium]
MFESLSDKVQEAFRKLSGKGRLSETDVKTGLRDVRLALLEADVNYRVVKDFTDRVAERAIGEGVIRSLTPAQMVIKIVHEELISLLGEPAKLDLGGTPPVVLMLVGLQGSGKTTMAAKLAVHLRKLGHRPLLVAADTYRPAAIQQLETLGRAIDITVHSEGDRVAPPRICRNGVDRARREGYTAVLLDTAGRLQIDDTMMSELESIRELTSPRECLLVVDSMTGQEAVAVAEEFNKRIGVTGLLLTKVDGDARGGAALSARSVTGVPIKFMGSGEKPTDLEPFYPDRLASRILGMGDMLTLIERAEATFDQKQAADLERKMRSSAFTLEDFIEQLHAVKSMGPLNDLLEMIPGMSQVTKQLPSDATERGLKTTEAIISSMTIQERRAPRIINASRRRRIARGSGTSVQEVNNLLRQFEQMQQMMKQLQSGRGMRGLMPRLR